MKKYKGIIFDSAGLGEASKYSKTTYKLNNFNYISHYFHIPIYMLICKNNVHLILFFNRNYVKE